MTHLEHAEKAPGPIKYLVVGDDRQQVDQEPGPEVTPCDGLTVHDQKAPSVVVRGAEVQAHVDHKQHVDDELDDPKGISFREVTLRWGERG